MLRAGLVGFGMAGRVFHGPLLSSVEGIELAAVLERTSNNASARYPGIATYRSLEAMLADTTLDFFVVATPSGTHFQVARQILEAGRPVVVDKPVAVNAADVANLIQLAAEKNTLLIPFHNRRWDSDFLTVRRLLDQQALGHLVYFESRFDRWRPVAPTDRLWKEDATQGGGVILDLGTHIADQALNLFGLPEAVSADIAIERPWARVNDSFTLRLRYPSLTVILGSNCLSVPPRPRFHLRGTRGNYWKHGMDPQEAALNKVTRIIDPDWGKEPQAEWGTLHLQGESGIAVQTVEPQRGDFRQYYAAVRDAILNGTQPPVAALDAWRVLRLLDWARQSSTERREIACDWSDAPR